MTADAVSQRLSLISTHWSLLSRAHDGAGAEVQAAQRQLLECYGGAVRRYLLGAVRDADVADDLFQEFACKFLRGSLRGADPGRGRFRDFLKGVLSHLATDHHRALRRRPQALPQDFSEPAVEDEPEADAAFRACWRDELLAHAWKALAEVEQGTGQPLCTVLRFRAENPELHSPEMAGRLGELLGRELTPVNVRQLLHRARERFAELLLEEVRVTLTEPTDADLHEELVEVGLFEYCRPALERR